MIQILLKTLREFPAWERPAQWSLGLSLAALAFCLLVVVAGPADPRLGALIGAFGALLVLQASILYSNRHMVNDLKLAQRAYLEDDLDTAVRLMEAQRASGRARWRELTLLGTAYRQQGRLDDSLEVIRAALVFAPDFDYPLYALGRTQLERGEYAPAAEAFQKALASGAPPEANLDLAEARWRAGDDDGARAALQALGDTPISEIPERVLLAALLRWRLLAADSPAPDVVAAGLPGWQALETHCAATPYGAALACDRETLSA